MPLYKREVAADCPPYCYQQQLSECLNKVIEGDHL